jgi:membrane protease YdiL (CAAX protease family)
MYKIISNFRQNIISNKLTSILLTGVFILLSQWSVYTGTLAHLAGYLVAMLLCVFIVEYFHTSRPQRSTLPIKNSQREFAVLATIIALQYVVSIFRFIVFSDFQSVHPGIRLSLFILMILVIYPVALIIYFFFLKKYRPSELGLRFDWRVAVSVILIAIIGSISFLVAPEKIRFAEFFGKMGLLQMIVLGFFSAAIPEEFMRIILQTRLGKVLNNRALGWFITGVIWAGVHIPNFYSQDKEMSSACIAALQILPLGLLWGYMTYRFKSIWPSVIIHGTNLWGLQNF